MDKIFEEYEDKLPKKLLHDIEKEAELQNLPKKSLELVLKKVLEKYENSKISPGEAIGIITAESFGEPSTQMCCSYDEKIIIKSDNKIKIKKIGEFVDKKLELTKRKAEAKGYEFCGDKDTLVLALDKDEKLKWKKVSKLNRVKAPEKLIKIKTKSGRTITATDFHSFVTRKNNKIVSIAGKYLKIGDRIPSMKYLPEHCITKLKTKDYIDFPSKNSFRVTREYRPTKFIPEEFNLDWSFGWFIGAYLAEGCANNHYIAISNLNDNYINNAKKFIENLGLDYIEDLHHRGFAPSRDLKVNSSLLSRFIINLCGKGSSNKKVPEFAYSAKEEFVSGLLRGYFDGDGNFTVNRRMIRASSNSKELLDGISLLLTRFNIFAFKSKDHKQDYLIIPYKYAPIFLNKIGSDIQYKKKSLEELTRLAIRNTLIDYKDLTDMISGFDNILIDISRKLGLPTRYVNSATKRRKIGRTALLRHMARFAEVAKEKNIDISKEFNILNTMYNSDVIWDEIESINYVSYGHKYVYDLTVPDLHTFTTFDGIITHNTLNTFHFAGVAEMNVTLGLPRLVEILDGRKAISTPTMEIYLKEDYKKEVDKVRKIASQIKETMLSEIASEFTINLIKSSVEVKLNKDRMKDLSITPLYLEKTVSEALKGINVKLKEEIVVIKPKTESTDIKELYKLKEKAKSVHIKGISGITQVLPVKIGGEFIILCAGSNIKEALQIKEVDETRIKSNDIFEVLEVFGIEAARQTIINEALKVIENQGLDIDIRHVMFMADVMTTTGKIKGITRSGITSEKESVLARASFETPLTHLINASLVGEVDELNSVVENVMLNQAVPLGTGLPGLLAKMLARVEKEDKKNK